VQSHPFPSLPFCSFPTSPGVCCFPPIQLQSLGALVTDVDPQTPPTKFFRGPPRHNARKRAATGRKERTIAAGGLTSTRWLVQRAPSITGRRRRRLTSSDVITLSQQASLRSSPTSHRSTSSDAPWAPPPSRPLPRKWRHEAGRNFLLCQFLTFSTVPLCRYLPFIYLSIFVYYEHRTSSMRKSCISTISDIFGCRELSVFVLSLFLNTLSPMLTSMTLSRCLIFLCLYARSAVSALSVLFASFCLIPRV